VIASLTPFGAFQRSDRATPELAAALEKAAYGALWVGGSPGGDLAAIEQLLDATSELIVATGIVNIWKDDAPGIAAAWHRISARHPGRFLLGIGVGHPEATGARYTKPYQALVDYLDALDAAEVPAQERVLAALGPRVLRLAAERTAGAHPYLTTPEHTRAARETLGPAPLLAPEQKVVLDDDPVRARLLARPAVATPYLSLTNYVSNLRRLGYSDEDLAVPGSDRLVDDLVAHGTLPVIAGRLHQHLEAGANHVAVNLVSAAGSDPSVGYRALAVELGLTPG
jgi:probable F420-dependent oxidoreductase